MAGHISWAIRISAPRSRQITTPAPHRSVFYGPDALPVAQPTASKHRRRGRMRVRYKNRSGYWNLSNERYSSLYLWNLNSKNALSTLHIRWTRDMLAVAVKSQKASHMRSLFYYVNSSKWSYDDRNSTARVQWPPVLANHTLAVNISLAVIIMPRRWGGALSDAAIRPSVCLSVRLDTASTSCYIKTSLVGRTWPRRAADVDPPRSAGGISSRRAITCFINYTC